MVGVEMALNGFVKIYRSLLEHPIFTQCPHTVPKVWLICLIRANWQKTKWYDGRTQIEVPAGCFVFSQESLAEDCNMTRKQIRTALKHLQNLGCVAIRRASGHSLLLVEKWSIYQLEGPEQGQLSGHERATAGPQEGHERASLYKEEEVKKLRREEEQQQAPLLTQTEWPLTTDLIQWRFPSVDSVFVLRLVQDSVQAAISSGIDPAELTDQRLRQIVHESINVDFARPGKTAGLLLKTVPQIIRNRAKSYLKETQR